MNSPRFQDCTHDENLQSGLLQKYHFLRDNFPAPPLWPTWEALCQTSRSARTHLVLALLERNTPFTLGGERLRELEVVLLIWQASKAYHLEDVFWQTLDSSLEADHPCCPTGRVVNLLSLFSFTTVPEILSRPNSGFTVILQEALYKMQHLLQTLNPRQQHLYQGQDARAQRLRELLSWIAHCYVRRDYYFLSLEQQETLWRHLCQVL